MSASRVAKDSPAVVWLVDDSQLEAEMARRALAAEYDVRVFGDGSSALEALAAAPPPHVLVLDWVMPGVSGIDVCRFLRDNPATAELPVLLLTNNQQTNQIVEGLSAGANDYLSKPYATAELQARVGALVRSRRLRDRAERAERLLHQVLVQLPDPVLTVAPDGVVVFANEQARAVFQRPGESLQGGRLAELAPALARPDSGADVEIAGRTFAPRMGILPGDAGGDSTVILRDVTDLRLKETRRLDFYQMVAHDLRSPLTALQVRTMLLLRGGRGELTPEIRTELEKTAATVRELVHMVTDFLDLAQMETARFQISLEPTDLASVCDHVHEEYRSVARDRGLELATVTGEASMVIGDERRLRQVVANLVANALKFTPAGGRVTLALSGGGDHVELSVEDTGAGIDDEGQRRLFTKYERVGQSKIEGTGLGLVIVKEIVEAHGGTVGVRSRLGQGSRFWCRFPRAPHAGVPPHTSVQPAAAANGGR